MEAIYQEEVFQKDLGNLLKQRILEVILLL
jgi:hypothetical protein